MISTHRISFASLFTLILFALCAPAQAATDSFWSTATIPGTADANDASAVNLGIKFTSTVNGTISAIRFYKGPTNTGTHTVALWSASGTKLASATSSNETASGWQTVTLSAPVSITAGTAYVASYHTNKGEYADDQNYFTKAYSNGVLSAPINAGVYKYASGTAFPNSSWNASNYWVDIVFTPSGGGTVVNGACGSSNGADLTSAPTANLCTTGTASAVGGSGPWAWSCAGSNGGTTASCQALLLINGACGSANGVAVSSAPSSNLCTTGLASAVSGSGPWTWSCAGSNGGTTASCSAPLASKVNGACGSANGVAVSTAPTANLCSAGTASAVTGSGPWNWSCAGSNGGTTASCSAPLAQQAVNGQCGSSNGVYTNVAPTTNLCSIGTASAVSGSGPWTWSCAGSNGGSTASCEALVGATSCPRGTTYPDGCQNAPQGTAQLPNLFSQPFPPHTTPYAVRPAWNLAGVDYRVGCSLSECTGAPAGSPAGKDPTVAANLPAGASYSNGTLSVTGSGNVTISGFNFCNPSGSPNGVALWVGSTGTTTVINNYFCGSANQLGGPSMATFCAAPNCDSGTNLNGALIFTYNEMNGGVPYAVNSCQAGNSMDNWLRSVIGGSNAHLTIQYNYGHNVPSKMFVIAGGSFAVTYQYNFMDDFGMAAGGSQCDHSEETFFWPGNSVTGEQSYNLSIAMLYADYKHNGNVNGATSVNWSEADPTTPTGSVYNGFNIHNNAVINVSSGGIVYFGGGCTSSACDPIATTGNFWNNNYIDWTGAANAYNGSAQVPNGSDAFGGTSWMQSFSGNKNLVTGNPCGTTYFSSGNHTTAIGDGGACN